MSIKSPIKSWAGYAGNLPKRYPIVSFLGVFSLLIALIVIGNIFKKPEVTIEDSEKIPVNVDVYRIGSSPSLSVQGEVQKNGVVTIRAQSGGVVKRINVTEGKNVAKGKSLVELSTNYQGQNLQSVQKAKAASAYQNAKSTYDTNKEIIEKQREIARQSDENSEELREITEASIDDTRTVLSLNNDLLDSVENQVDMLESISPRTPEQESALASLKGQRVQLAASVLQLNASVRQSEYQSDNDSSPAKLSKLQKELTLKQLDLQEKALRLSLEISRLDYAASQITESLMFPAAPFDGTVERIKVKIGQTVNPGDELIVITSNDKSSKIVAYVSKEVAKTLSPLEPAKISIDSDVIEVMPQYVSSEPTDGNLFTVIFLIDAVSSEKLAEGQYVQISLPVGGADTGSTIPFIPLDAVYRTQTHAFVFIAENSESGQMVAKSREIVAGEVFGNYVEVISGLNDKDAVILNRNVNDSEAVIVSQN